MEGVQASNILLSDAKAAFAGKLKVLFDTSYNFPSLL